MELFYKWLNPKKAAIHGRGKWPRLNAWLSAEGPLEECRSGLHLCRETDLIHWIGPELWEAEADTSELITCEDKVVVRRARLIRRVIAWNESSARLFAALCAEKVLVNFERLYHGDSRPRFAIEAAKLSATGGISANELRAVRSAAESAAWSAARSAVRSAAESWQNQQLLNIIRGDSNATS